MGRLIISYYAGSLSFVDCHDNLFNHKWVSIHNNNNNNNILFNVQYPNKFNRL